MRCQPLFHSVVKEVRVNLDKFATTLLLCCLFGHTAASLRAQGSGVGTISHFATLPFTVIDVPGAGTKAEQGTIATAIDAAGDVAGIYLDSNSYVHAFIFTSGGVLTPFDAVGSGGNNTVTAPIGFDMAGDLMGIYRDANKVQHGFVRTSGGGLTFFDVASSGNLPAAGIAKNQGTVPLIINGAGEIAGIYIDSSNLTHGFVRSAAGVITPFDAATITGASGKSNQGVYFVTLNASGVVAGTYIDANSLVHGFIRSASGAITTVDDPNAGTGVNQGTAVSSIDANGDVAGIYIDANQVIHGFEYSSAGTFSTIDAPGTGTGSYQGTLPNGFDANGDITGAYVDANNVGHGFFLPANGAIVTYDAPGVIVPQALVKSVRGRLLASPKKPTGFLGKSKSFFSKMGRVSPGLNSILTGGSKYPYATASFGDLGLNSVNAAGEITGLFTKGDAVVHGFLRAANGTLTTFDAPSAGTGVYQGTGGLAINASGVIAGGYADSNGTVHGFVYNSAALSSTTTSLQSGASTSIYGGPITLTATVSPAPPNGEVVWFMSGSTVIGSQTLSNGSAQLNTTTTPVGSYSVTAVYPGDLTLSGSTSSAVSQTVSQASTTTSLKSSPNPSTFGQAVTLAATVSGQYGGTPTGSVTFSWGNESSIVPLNSGLAVLMISALPEGTDSITAVYSGDTNFTGSTSSSLSQVVNAASNSTSFVYTLAGDGINGYSGDGGLATSASINQPQKAVMDSAGNLYISDSSNNRIRMVAAGTGIITTLAGTGIAGWSGDNGPAASAQLNSPDGLALDEVPATSMSRTRAMLPSARSICSRALSPQLPASVLPNIAPAVQGMAGWRQAHRLVHRWELLLIRPETFTSPITMDGESARYREYRIYLYRCWKWRIL